MTPELTMELMTEELGVSRATLSAVLNGREKRQRVSEATAARVRDYLARRGYVRPKSALQLRKGAPRELTGIMYCGNFLQFGHLVQALSLLGDHVRSKHGLVEITGVDPEHSLDALREQISKGVRNLVWIHANPPDVEMRNAELLFPLLERLERVVIFNYDFREPKWEGEFLRRGIHLLGYDRPAAYRQAAELFAREGRHKMGFPEYEFGSNAPLSGAAPMKELFRQHGVEILGVHPEGGHIHPSQDAAPCFAENIAELFRTEGLDCAFVRHDLRCAEVVAHLRHMGINVPDDIAVIGFGDLPLLALLPVPLTTFALPVEALCREAVALLEAETPPPAKRIELEIPLIMRSSHGKS